MDIESVLKRGSNKQLLALERILPEKYYERIESIRFSQFIRTTDFETLDVSKRNICHIKKDSIDFPLFQVYFMHTMMKYILYCLSMGWLPRVEYLNQDGVNLWEQFLIQPYAEVTGMDVTNMELDAKKAKHWMPSFPTKEEIQLYHRLYKSVIVFNDKTQAYIDAECERILTGRRVLGVLCRGTDYTANRPKGHQIQPETEVLIQKAHKMMEKCNCQFIYLATEEKRIEDQFQTAFPGRVLVNKRHYYDTFYDLREKYGDRVRISWVHDEDDNNSYFKSLEYLSSIVILSQCNALVAGNCGGSISALYFNGNRYDDYYLFNLGTY